MSGTTPTLAFPYPTTTDPPNGATQIEALAEAVEAAWPLTITTAAPGSDVSLTNDAWTDVCTLASIVVAGVARRVRLEAHATFQNTHGSAAAACALRIIDTVGGATVAVSGKVLVGPSVAGGIDHGDLVVAQTISASVATHTYKLQAYKINGTVSVLKAITLAGEAMVLSRLAAVS